MAQRRYGWNQALTVRRLGWLLGTDYPEPPRELFIAFYTNAPFDDGAGVAELERVRVGPIAFLPVVTEGVPSQCFLQPVEGVTVALAGNAEPPIPVHLSAWGLHDSAKGGLPLYTGSWPNGVLLVGRMVTLAPQTFRVYAEMPH